MGFPSPAADYVESRLSLDEALIQKPAATYYMRAGETIYRCGIMKDALLVIDSSLKPCDGSLLICDCNGEFKVKRYRTYPQPHLENVANGKKERLPGNDEGISGSLPIFGVITYIINDARTGEFDDCPVM
ncbi:TPA: LexA family transcriptional regulator [Enterobacter hormaechei subsp. xiangfangensis]|nr:MULTISPECIES: S24 family peptidase [Enterobacter cloacae complex]RYA69298.1 DNA polymerase V [Enterobacter cloacae complex sp. 2DZ2F16B1]MCE1514384.1 LexA family transcriptional regulator [Enterobacter hormaechei]MCW6016681.1 LexA family transcriptional regulator [Enterobacter hormaechei subsp. xiangfangensis]MCW6040244.1 LexA family transcriptional regulator [Enterobacter hormaechei subsp. xiangfangensis]MCW6044978.1 LexA family transcriptional regulator [Enterobacter hormaechei subsp. xia